MLEITDGGIGDFGDMRWELVGVTILAWVVVYFCLFKGIKSSGKVKSACAQSHSLYKENSKRKMNGSNLFDGRFPYFLI